MAVAGNLREEITILIKETESLEDAMQYIEEVATDCNVTIDQATKELRFQYGVSL